MKDSKQIEDYGTTLGITDEMRHRVGATSHILLRYQHDAGTCCIAATGGWW